MLAQRTVWSEFRLSLPRVTVSFRMHYLINNCSEFGFVAISYIHICEGTHDTRIYSQWPEPLRVTEYQEGQLHNLPYYIQFINLSDHW